jgi:prophage regulatory protein
MVERVTPQQIQPRLQRIVRKSQLPDYVGLRRTAIDDLMASGAFPKPVKLGLRAVGWTEESLIRWQQERIAASKSS